LAIAAPASAGLISESDNSSSLSEKAGRRYINTAPQVDTFELGNLRALILESCGGDFSGSSRSWIDLFSWRYLRMGVAWFMTQGTTAVRVLFQGKDFSSVAAILSMSPATGIKDFN
jgi:hypothetical protein